MNVMRLSGGSGTILQFNFRNSTGSLKVLDEPGIQVISTGCGSGKTTAIRELISLYNSDGVLYSASTIRECNEMYDWLIENVVDKNIMGSIITKDDIICIHSEPRYDENGNVNNGVDLETWNNNPMKLKDKKVLICTHHKLFHEYPELLIGYNLNMSPIVSSEMNEYEKVKYVIPEGAKQLNPRRYVLIDEFPTCGVLKKDYMKSDLPQFGMSVINKKYNWQSGKMEFKEDITRYNDFNMMVYKYDKITPTNERYKITGSTSEPAEFRKRMILSDLHRNYDKYIKSPEEKIRASCNILNLENSYSRILLFEGTGDLLYSGDNGIRVCDVYPKYNSMVSYVRLGRFINRTNQIETESDKLKLLNKLDESIDELISSVFNRPDVNKVLIVTWKNLKSNESDNRNGIFSSKINENFNLTEYITNKLTGRVGDKEFRIIYYQSGLDRATNEFREFDSVVFLGKFQIPDSAVSEINGDLGSDCTPRRYLLHQLVQAVCRTRIRNHNKEDINVFYTGDWSPGVINDLISYVGGSRLSLNADIDSLGIKNKWKLAINKLIEYEPELFDAMKNKLEYNLEIDLDDLYCILPMSEKKVKKYIPLSKYMREFNIDLTINTKSNNKGS